MADEQTPLAGTNEVAPATTPNMASATVPAPDAENVEALPAWAQKVIGELRKESASHRKAKTEAERQAQAQQEAAAKEQGKWQELAERYEPKAKRADALDAFITAMLDDELKDVPDKLKGIIPAYEDALKTLEWVRNAKAAGVLAKPTPQTDAAASTGDKGASNAVAAKQQELDWWRQMGFHNAVAAVENNRGK